MIRHTYLAGIFGTLLFFAAAAPAYASTPSLICPTLSSNLSVGVSGPQVASLQASLGVTTTGYFGPLTKAAVIRWQSAHGVPATGFVGPLTRAAFAQSCGGGDVPPPSQSTNFNATPVSGAAPLAVTFSLSNLDASSNYVISYGDGTNSGSLQASPCSPITGCTITMRHTYASAGTYTATFSPYIACLYSNPHCMIAVQVLGSVMITVGGSTTTVQPSIYSINPVSGPTGTNVTVSGFGFTSDNTILFGGNAVAHNVPITSSIAVACTTDPNCHGGIRQTLTFTVPSSIAPSCPGGSVCPMYLRLVTPGPYDVSVQNVNGTSNVSSFTVTSVSPQY